MTYIEFQKQSTICSAGGFFNSTQLKTVLLATYDDKFTYCFIQIFQMLCLIHKIKIVTATTINNGCKL